MDKVNYHLADSSNGTEMLSNTTETVTKVTNTLINITKGVEDLLGNESVFYNKTQNDLSNLTRCHVNETSHVTLGNSENLRAVIGIFRTVVWPILIFSGILGNILNIIALRSLKHKFAGSVLEKFYYNMLIALAVADMAFCVLCLPWFFIPLLNPDFDVSGFPEFSLERFYSQFSEFPIMTCACCGTLITTTVSIVRVASIKWPIVTRMHIDKSRKLIIVTVILSIVFNSPRLYTYEAFEVDEERQLFRVYYRNNEFFYRYRLAYIIVGVAIPIAILVCSTIGVLYYLKQAGRINEQNNVVMRRHSHQTSQHTSRVMKLMLVAIVIEYVICTLPSQIAPYCDWLELSHFHLLIAITNCIGASNYALNYVLYSLLNAQFRRFYLPKSCCSTRTEHNDKRKESLSKSSISTVTRLSTGSDKAIVAKSNGQLDYNINYIEKLTQKSSDDELIIQTNGKLDDVKF